MALLQAFVLAASMLPPRSRLLCAPRRSAPAPCATRHRRRFAPSHHDAAATRQVLSLRYGLEDGAALSWKQIAARCDMPEKQLQLAQSRALRKLRKQRALRQLRPLCDHDDWEQDALGTMAPGERLGAR